MTNELLRFQVAKAAGWDFDLHVGGNPDLREVRFGSSHRGYIGADHVPDDREMDALGVPYFATSLVAAGALIDQMGRCGGEIDITNATEGREWLCRCVRQDGRDCRGIAKTFERAVCLCFLEAHAVTVVAEAVG